jgi:hypothetical protein
MERRQDLLALARAPSTGATAATLDELEFVAT